MFKHPMPRLVRGVATVLFLLVVAGSNGRLYAQAPYSETMVEKQLAQAISDTIGTDTFSGALWGVHIVNLRSGNVLYSENADYNFVPASNVKLLTTAAALDQLGPTFRFRTRVYVDGPIENGTLKGNLVVRGSGDPTIGGHEQRENPAQVFRQWADSLRRLGITHIDGNIVGDDNRLDETPLGHGWSWDDATHAYAAEIGGLVFNENTVDLRVRGREPTEPALVTWEPFSTDYVQVKNRSRTIPFRDDEDEEYQRIVGTNTIHVQTKVHPNSVETESITITNPTQYFTHILRDVLLQEGISVNGESVDLDETNVQVNYGDTEVRRVASYTSPPLSDIAQTLNHESQNLYAEQLLRTIAAEVPPETDEDLPPGSSELGVKAVRETLVEAEVDTSRVQIVDGSGLSRQNLVRPRSLVRLLQYMWLHPDAEVSTAFYNALPTGGQQGTLKYRFQGTAPARENVRAKTGTLSNMSSLSGYVTSENGTPLAFSVLCNHHLAEGDQVRSAQDIIVNALARLPL